MSNEVSLPSSLEDFRRRRLVTEVLQTLKSGKEATVYRCAAHPSTGRRHVAMKAYRPLAERAFRDDRVYRESLVVRESRVARAIRDRSAYGMRAAVAEWASREYDALRRLRAGGLAVPEPIARGGDAILMEFLGDDASPAPQLRAAGLDDAAAERCARSIVAWIGGALRLDRVHGDLSPYNVLWWRGRAIVIDLPQAVDARVAPSAEMLLRRDLSVLARFFARWRIALDGERIADDLWRRYTHGGLDRPAGDA